MTGSADVASAVRAAASAVHLDEHPAGRLRMLALENVIAQTRAAANHARVPRSDRAEATR
jgi:hypothetical protein